MINTSAPLYDKDAFKNFSKRQQAELYSRMFSLMAEDFTTNTDVKQYILLLSQSITALQEELRSLFTVVANHTHMVPPHVHALIPHVHLCPATSVITSPNFGDMASTLPTPLVTNIPVETGMIRWNTIRIPDLQNTTGVTPNIGGSSVKVGLSKEGPLFMGKRRLKEPLDLYKTVSIPPILKPKGIL